MTDHPLLMRCSLAELRAKLNNPASPLAPWWRHVLALARRDPEFFSSYCVLAALVTGEPGDRALARRAFLSLVEAQDEGLVSQETQFHTHVVSAPLGRWAVFYDWIHGSGILSPAEEASFRDFLQGYAVQFSWQHVVGRARNFDNQLMANAFGASAVGWVLARFPGSAAVGRRLFVDGTQCLRWLLGHLPEHGYSLEGSTYHENVVLPMSLLSTLLMAEVAGDPLPPALFKLIETSFRMLGPDGLLPPWDDYGYQPSSVRCGLSLLANLRHDPAPLRAVRAAGLWYRTDLIAWETDDRLWTLVWWPDAIDDGRQTAEFAPWMEPQIAGALQDAPKRFRLFQYWDECGGIPSSGREQVNPNAIALEAYGSPLLMDGYGALDPALLPIPTEQALAYAGRRTVESVQEYIRSSWNAEISTVDALKIAMAGAVGLSNSLILDGESWYVPKAPRHGIGEALHHAGPMQVVRSDATDYYRDRYDVKRVARTSLQSGGRYILVCDRLVADSAHGVTWQAYLRPEAGFLNGRVVVHTAEQVRLDFIPLQPGTLELVEARGYPAIGEKRSLRLRHAVGAGTDIRLDVALVPQPAADLAMDLTAGWVRELDGAGVSLADAYLTDPATAPEAGRTFRRSFSLVPVAGRRYHLRLAVTGRGVRVLLNDRQLTPLIPDQNKNHWEGSGESLPWTYDATTALRPGENCLVIHAPYFHGESVRGPLELLVEREADAVTVERIGVSSFRVCIGADEDLVLMENEAGVVDWAGGRTDARYAVRTADGTIAAAAVTTLSVPGAPDFASPEPRDIVWSKAGGLAVIAACPAAGAGRSVAAAAEEGRAVPAAPVPSLGSAPVTVDAVFALEGGRPADVGPMLIEVLRGKEWLLQVAAAEVCGRLGVREAVPELLRLFAEGEKELPYPPIRKRWRVSKMLRDPQAEVGPDPSVPRPVGVRRWQLKRAVVAALGRLGDPHAVAPLEAAMKRCTDFFPVTSQIAVALGRLGAASSIPILETHFNHAEMNTRLNARHALALLKGEIGRREFDARVGL